MGRIDELLSTSIQNGLCVQVHVDGEGTKYTQQFDWLARGRSVTWAVWWAVGWAAGSTQHTDHQSFSIIFRLAD